MKEMKDRRAHNPNKMNIYICTIYMTKNKQLMLEISEVTLNYLN